MAQGCRRKLHPTPKAYPCIKVIPSDLFPSSIAKLVGSKTAGILMIASAPGMISLMLAYRSIRPALVLQERPWCPRESSGSPHWQWCGAPQSAPNRRQIASRKVLSPNIDLGWVTVVLGAKGQTLTYPQPISGHAQQYWWTY